ncbi:MAG: YitT family protein [Clostridia bacterium]|nr:YitT family protein [Clostridia bacterium]
MAKNKKAIIWDLIWDVLIITLGSICYAASIVCFLEPNHISPGGVSGLATIIHYLFEALPTGLMIVVLNIPLFVLGIIFIGFKFIAKTGIATLISASLVDAVTFFFPNPLTTDRTLAAIYGGLLLGAGIGLVMARNATTGGTDIAAKLINRKFPNITMGRSILLMDVLVVAASTIVYGEPESALYTVIALFVSSKIIDIVLYGTDHGKILYIVSEKHQEIADEIINTLDRGVTFLPAKGAYTNNDITMIMCAVRSAQVVKVRSLIRRIDPKAFVMVAEAGAILGEGFDSHEQE